MSDPLVVLRDVVKDYTMGQHLVRALDGISLSIGRGVMAAIIGPSGSGKSTLLYILGALDRPSTGEVIVDGVHLHNLSEGELTAYRRRTVGFVFQDYNLIPNLSALENVMLPLEFTGVEPGLAEQRAQTLLEAVGLAHRANHRPSRLSGGEQQRVAIARALANDPPIILADEPTGNLDTTTGEQIVHLLNAFVADEGKTVIIVTHDAAIVEAAEMKVGIKDGKIIDAQIPAAR